MPNIYKKYSGKELENRPQFCDRCGNDFLKGFSVLHFPYAKMYIYLCHICLQGLMYGFYADMSREIKKFKKDE